MACRHESAMLGLCGWLALLAGCSGGSDPTKPDPCANSICATAGVGGGAGSSAGGSSGTAGSAGSGPAGGASGSGGGPGSGGSTSSGGNGGTGPIGPPADLDMDFYKCNVEPIVDKSCAMMGCHGTVVDRPYVIYARGRLRNDEMVDNTGSCLKSGKVNLNADGTGTVMCEGWMPHTAAEWQKNYDSARAFMTQGMNPDDSELLRQATQGMGFQHVGVHPFRKDDADYTMIRRWLSGEKLGGACNPGPN